MKRFSFIIFLAIIFFSCKKDRSNLEDRSNLGEGVEFYLLKNYQVLPGQCNLNTSIAVLQDSPFVYSPDIKVYDKTNYEFTLTPRIIQQIQTFKDGTPYAVTVDKQVIYFAYFKPLYSSSVCLNSIAMDVDWLTQNKIYLRFSSIQGQIINDNRNHPTLLSALANQGKLR